jgi:hypothetical protein
VLIERIENARLNALGLFPGPPEVPPTNVRQRVLSVTIGWVSVTFVAAVIWSIIAWGYAQITGHNPLFTGTVMFAIPLFPLAGVVLGWARLNVLNIMRAFGGDGLSGSPGWTRLMLTPRDSDLLVQLLLTVGTTILWINFTATF